MDNRQELSSQNLKRNYINEQKSNGVNQDTIAWEIEATQAHHVIPIQIANNLYTNGKISSQQYKEFDNAWNCLLLSNSPNELGVVIYHNTRHDKYSQMILELINNEDDPDLLIRCKNISYFVKSQIEELLLTNYESLNINLLPDFLQWIVQDNN